MNMTSEEIIEMNLSELLEEIREIELYKDSFILWGDEYEYVNEIEKKCQI